MIGNASSYTLLAIPFFILAAKLMNTGGITRRIFRACSALIGWIPGGLGHANVLASIVFSGMSGSAVADAGGLGQIEVDAMIDDGFDPDFSAVILYKGMTIREIYEALKQAVADGAGILNIICGAAAFSWLVTMMGLTNALSHALTSLTDKKYIMLLILSIAFLLI